METNDDLPDLLTVPEVQEYLRIGRSTAYGLVKAGEIRSVRFGGTLRVPREALVEFLDASKRR